MKITLVTTTRNRALCFSLLEKHMARQTLPFSTWLVVNDGAEEYRYTLGQEVISRDPSHDTLPSICQNWLAACDWLKDKPPSWICPAEDDDAYDPEYLATLAPLLDEVDLAGVSHDVYWKFPTRKFQRMHNDQHASLAASCWRSTLLPEVERVAKLGSIFLDMILWAEHEGTKKLIPQPLPNGRMLHVGLKGMPGAAGLGIGHQSPNTGSSDPQFVTLQRWLGSEATGWYRRLWRD
jgi:hypothetical protein